MPNVTLRHINTLADLVIYKLTATCGGCRGIVQLSGARLIAKYGPDETIERVFKRMKCRRCRKPAKNIQIEADRSESGAHPFKDTVLVKIVGEP